MGQSVLMALGKLDVPEDVLDFYNRLQKTPLRGSVEKISTERSVGSGRPAELHIEKVLREMHFAARWAAHSFPIYELTHSLVAMLLLTEPLNRIISDVDMPFPSFAIRTSPGMGLDGGADGSGEIRFTTMHRYIESRSDSRTGVANGEVVCIFSSGTGPKMLESTALGKESIFDWIYRRAYNKNDLPEGIEPLAHPHSRTVLVSLRRLIINLCSWITSGGEVAERMVRRRTSSSDPGPGPGLDVPRIWVVGRDVKLDRELTAASRALSEHEAGRGGTWKLQRRFVVRGHERNQRFGRGRAEIKRIFIRPFWKGPKDSVEAWIRVYKAGTMKR